MALAVAMLTTGQVAVAADSLPNALANESLTQSAGVSTRSTENYQPWIWTLDPAKAKGSEIL